MFAKGPFEISGSLHNLLKIHFFNIPVKIKCKFNLGHPSNSSRQITNYFWENKLPCIKEFFRLTGFNERFEQLIG